jgi:uncharacterized repeat protein (TIGR01451 family)
MPRRTRTRALLVALAVLAVLAGAAPAAAAAAPPQVLGRRAVTFQSPPTGTAKATWLSSSQGQLVDTNGNGLLDSLQARGADLENFGIKRFREAWVRLQAQVDTNGNGIPDSWVDKAVNGVDVVNGDQPAYAVITTTPKRLCFVTDAQRTYRAVHRVIFRRNDDAVGNRTLASNTFQARRLATDTDCAPPPPLPSADLAVTKTAVDVQDPEGGDTVGPIADLDDSFNYVLTVTNNGPDRATALSIRDTWPFGLDDPALADPDATCEFVNPTDPAATEVVACSVIDLDSGETVTITIGARTNGEASGDLTNTVTVAADQQDPVAGNNSDTLTVPVTA